MIQHDFLGTLVMHAKNNLTFMLIAYGNVLGNSLLRGTSQLSKKLLHRKPTNKIM